VSPRTLYLRVSHPRRWFCWWMKLATESRHFVTFRITRQHNSHKIVAWMWIKCNVSAEIDICN
jgi:hypothetical protein